MAEAGDPSQEFGRIDIYLFDQILRGRIDPDMRVLDAGCGAGRNLVYLMRAGADVYGVDRDARAIEQIRELAAKILPEGSAERFHQGELTDLPFADAHIDVVICSAVLHFANHEQHFDDMVAEMWRVLRPGGIFFARLASTIGIETLVRATGPSGPRGGARYELPDGSERFCVDLDFLLALTDLLGGELLDPIKTTNVQNQRCMTTWVVRKVSS